MKQFCCGRKGIVLAFLLAAPALSIPAQEGFFIAPVVETTLFSTAVTAFGGGLAFGYDGAVMLGYRALYFIDPDGLATLELGIFLRVYLPPGRHDGFFIQAGAGPCVFIEEAPLFPPKLSSTSAGVILGWRFLLSSRWYVEPYLRAGYPYVAGAGASVGFRF
jgi:hypothetical protein